jgi:DNA repair protein RecO (recombination protein O)
MNTHISPAIIMRIKEFGETDLLVTFFTSDKGQLKGVAKGARKSRKRFVNALDIFSLVNLEYGLKREGALYFLHSGKLIDAYPGLRSNFASLSIASFMIELAEVLFPQGVAEHRMFGLLKGSFHCLDKGKALELTPVIFESRAMALGGYGIHLEKCCICGRPYTGQGNAVFLRQTGCIACLKCKQKSALAPSMSPDSVKSLNLMQSKSLLSLNILDPSPETMIEIKSVLKLHREYRLEKKLKTSKYVA